MSLATIKEHAKQCPDCGMATEKSEGCNKMVCGNCGAYWCWK
jgi:E3 ubiquitin-protein ligase RNF14